jgi:hypothetical protein
MNCEETQDRLERWFDEEAPLSSEAEAHLADCDSCRSYQNELAAVRDALGRLPIEAPAPGLANRVKMHVAAHGTVHETRLPVAAGWGLAAGVVAAACVAGWFIPISVELRAWGNTAIADALGLFPTVPASLEGWRDATMAYVPGMDWRQTVSSLYAQLSAFSASATLWMDEATGWLPPSVLWLIIAVGAMLLIGCNGFEALRLRTTTINGSNRVS